MSRLLESYTIDLSSGASFDVVLENLVDTIYLTGTAGGNVQIQEAGASTPIQGMELTFKFSGDMATNTLTLFGEDISFTGSIQWTASVLYRNSAWEVRVKPDFEETNIITQDHLNDAIVGGAELVHALDLTAQTITNVDIDSGDIDGVDIGLNSAKAASFTTIGASGGITGNVTGNVTGDVTGDLTGKADTADALETARTIAGQSFDGTGNVSIAPTDLTAVTAPAVDINLLLGAAAAGVTVNDIKATADISNAMEADTNGVTIKTGKYLEVDGYVKETNLATSTDPTTSDTDDDYIVCNTSSNNITVNLPAPASVEGKKMYILNIGTWNTVVTTVAGTSVFRDYGTGTAATVNVKARKSLLVVSDGTYWNSFKRTDGFYTLDNIIRGVKNTIIVPSTVLKPLLDTSTNDLLELSTGDIVVGCKLVTHTACGGAGGLLAVGGDSDLISAGVDNDAFLNAADLDTIGYYQPHDPAGTYKASELNAGYFECDARGYVTVTSTVDQTGGAFVGSLIIDYIPA